MAFLGNEKIKSLLASGKVISDYDEKNVKNGAYELSLGEEVFQTDANPRTVKKLAIDDKIEIKPGQFALLLTREEVKIPKDRIAFISIKAGVKFKGLVNVSGFHVDPGFEGKLLFSVYNAGPSSILLTSGKPYFPIWFAELSESQEYKGTHEKQQHIPDGPIESLSQGELASPAVLSKRIDDFKSDINGRVTGIERDQKAINYMCATAIALGITLIFKFVFDISTYKANLRTGMEIKNTQVAIDSAINVELRQKMELLHEIDSLRNVDSIMLTKKVR